MRGQQGLSAMLVGVLSKDPHPWEAYANSLHRPPDTPLLAGTLLMLGFPSVMAFLPSSTTSSDIAFLPELILETSVYTVTTIFLCHGYT